METKEVVDTLSSLSYRPGWTFDAHLPFSGNLVIFEVTCRTVNTDRDCARKGYSEPKVLAWQELLNADDYPDREALLSAVFGWLMAIELHESREFFRVKSEDYAAPFHPHREDGNAMWDRSLLSRYFV